MDYSLPGICPQDFPGENTGVGCHFLLQRIFPTQGSNPSLLRLLSWQVCPLPLHHLGSQKELQRGGFHPFCGRVRGAGRITARPSGSACLGCLPVSPSLCPWTCFKHFLGLADRGGDPGETKPARCSGLGRESEHMRPSGKCPGALQVLHAALCHWGLLTLPRCGREHRISPNKLSKTFDYLV